MYENASLTFILKCNFLQIHFDTKFDHSADMFPSFPDILDTLTVLNKQKIKLKNIFSQLKTLFNSIETGSKIARFFSFYFNFNSKAQENSKISNQFHYSFHIASKKCG